MLCGRLSHGYLAVRWAPGAGALLQLLKHIRSAGSKKHVRPEHMLEYMQQRCVINLVG